MELEFDIRSSARELSGTPEPFNLLVLGDFSAAGRAPSTDLKERRIRRVDLDCVDALWSVLEPRRILDIGPAKIDLQPRDIDDFHPDALFRNLPEFAALRSLRSRLSDPATATDTLAELLSGEAVGAEAAKMAGEPPEDRGRDDEDLFERLLGRKASPAVEGAAATAVATRLDQLIRDLVAPYIVENPDPRVDAAITSVDHAIAELMRRILHHPDFQRLEASWRSLTDLVTELELDESLGLFVCDIKRSELLNGLPDPGSSLQESQLFQLLVERRRQAADDAPWSVIVGDFYFDGGNEDVALLTALGAVAAANGGTFLAAARPQLLGCQGAAELPDARYWSNPEEEPALWQTLRASPVAPHIGLALPRVLGRLPYGKETEPVDGFEFEEMPDRNHEHYLWLNPAYACGRLLAQAYTQDGWSMQPGDHVDLGVLPAHHFTDDGESRLQPCAEVLLSESTMVTILEHGLMPLISYRNQNTAVLGRFQSIASPARALVGPWR